jgi:hypothetical protein
MKPTYSKCFNTNNGRNVQLNGSYIESIGNRDDNEGASQMHPQSQIERRQLLIQILDDALKIIDDINNENIMNREAP